MKEKNSFQNGTLFLDDFNFASNQRELWPINKMNRYQFLFSQFESAEFISTKININWFSSSSSQLKQNLMENLSSKIIGPDFLCLSGWILNHRFQIQQIIGGDIQCRIVLRDTLIFETFDQFRIDDLVNVNVKV